MTAFVIMAALTYLALGVPLAGRVLGPVVQTLSVPIIGLVFCLETLKNLDLLDIRKRNVPIVMVPSVNR